MKRSNELRPLSVEHHHGLVQALQLKKAAKGELILDDVVSIFLQEWDKVIEPHFCTEEDFLVPAYLEGKKSNQTLVDDFCKQHANLRELVNELKDSIGNLETSLICNIATNLESHIRFEERQLFPEIEKVLTQEELKDLGEKLAYSCKTYE